MAISFRRIRGFFGLTGPIIDNIAAQALKSAPAHINADAKPPYHVTVFTKQELEHLDKSQLAQVNVDATHVFAAGIGGGKGVFFVVIIFAAGQQLRKKFKLPPKQFHITLSTHDDHEMDKGIQSLFPGQYPSNPSPEFLDHLAFTDYVFGDYQQAMTHSIQLCKALPESHKGFLRLADAALSCSLHKLAMLSFACAFDQTVDEKVKEYCIKKLVECSNFSEWGLVLQNHEVSQIPTEITSALFSSWSMSLRLRLSESTLIPTLCLESRVQLVVPISNSLYKLPRFFRWLIPYHIAIMSTPRNSNDISALASPSLGIRHVLTLTEEEPLDPSWFAGKPITNTYLPVQNYHPPSLEQMDIIMRLVEDEDKLPILIHCGGGKGRAGTVAACYLAAYGFCKPDPKQDHPEMAAQDVIATLRNLRPGSIETPQQEAFVSKWCSTIWKRQSVYPEIPSEPPPCSMELEGTLNKDSNLFVLVGLPGSGKSWFSKSLLARDRSSWIRISQDDARSRAACETEIGRNHTSNVLLDRCNTAASDRKVWLQLAANWAVSPVCIWFDYPKELCMSRAQMRIGHPTLPPGSRVRNAIQQMDSIFVKPALAEGFKAIVIIRSFAAAHELLLRLSRPISLYKFLRTPHLIDLGAVGSDDIMAQNIPTLSGHVVITEKVDGSQLGFSLSEDRSQILVQNRSHFVNPTSHEQYKKLGLWVEHHREELYKILDRDPFFPERYILFGEWLYATHSIPYTDLPGRFMAFDLYDRSANVFVDRKTLTSLLAPTSIHIVPVIQEGAMPSEAELISMVQRRSQFWDGRLEGVYVKIERDGQVVSRGKVVRGDFIAGNRHWTKNMIQVNGMRLVLDE